MSNIYKSTDTLLADEIALKRNLNDTNFTQLGFIYNSDTAVRLIATGSTSLTISSPNSDPPESILEVSKTKVDKSIIANASGDDLYLISNDTFGNERIEIRENVYNELRGISINKVTIDNSNDSDPSAVSIVKLPNTTTIVFQNSGGQSVGISANTIFLGQSVTIGNTTGGNGINLTTSEVSFYNGDSSSILSQANDTPINGIDTLQTSANFAVNSRLYLGDDSGVAKNAYLTTDSYTLNCNGPDNSASGWLDVRMCRAYITDTESQNYNVLQYKSDTRIDVLKSSDFSLAGTVAYVADGYSTTTYSTSTFSSNISDVNTDWSNYLIVKIDPTSNNDNFTIPTASLDSYSKVKVVNVSANNHTADVLVNGTSYSVQPGAGLTAVKTPVGYWAFSAL